MWIEVHAIQTFGPSNLNRDDTGNPKEALFGGVRRARVSSQSAKRAKRISSVFEQAIQVPSGTRTKGLIGELVKRLVQEGVEEEPAQAYAEEIITKVYAKLDKKAEQKTSVLLYISEEEFNMLAGYMLEAQAEGSEPDIAAIKKDFEKRLKDRTAAPDIALFGRMLAENPDLNIDAACQVQHALSTHEVNTAEFDYYTAVDDWQPDDNAGAGMLGLIAFNSATYYRHARIDWEQLVRNLRGDVALARQTVQGFMHAFAVVVPSGMQNSFVNLHKPDFLLAVVRPDHDGQSLSNAFEQPVQARHGSGYTQPSIERLVDYWEKIERAYRQVTPTLSVLNPQGFDLPSEELTQATRPTLMEWITTVLHELPQEEVSS